VASVVSAQALVSFSEDRYSVRSELLAAIVTMSPLRPGSQTRLTIYRSLQG
jgi:hypothetical protein